MTRFSIALAALLAAAFPADAAPAQTTITVPKTAVRVIDGDTIEIQGKVIDIYGMDAPELGQRCLHNNDAWSCGLDAAFALQKLVGEGSGDIKCFFWGGTREDGRVPTAVCDVSGRDVAHTMIFNGFAVAPPGVFPTYPDTQSRAKKTGLGIWRGRFVMPWDWRAGVRLDEEAATENKNCPVKSVIGPNGKRTYFVPTDKNFKKITVDVTAGGRCYLSDEEARLAQAPPPPPKKKALGKRRPKKRAGR